jgi:ABC-2 type transport system permease protein
VSDPDVLILDEPTIGLDPQQITEIRSLIKSLAGQHTVILSTHILPEVSMVCDAVIIINKGGIVAQGPIDTLVEQFFPTSRLEVEIVGPSPVVRERIRAIPGVLSVEDQPPANGVGRYTVEAARDRDVRAEIFQLAAQQRWDLLELKRVGTDARGGLHPGRRRGGIHPGFRRGLRGGTGAVKIWAIFKKEMRLYFTSPVAWVVFTIFLLIAGYFFYSIFAFFTLASMQSAMNPQMGRDLNVTDSVMRPLFSNISVILLLLMPLVTMRLFAEERRAGTIELLLTYPVRDGAVLAGKYLAALGLYAIMIGLTLLYPGIVVYFARLEWGPILTGYLGLLLMGATFIAVGVFASSLTENQIVAAITTFGALLIFWILGWSADYAGGTAGKVLQFLSILEHNDSFSKGVLDTKDVLYYLNFTVLALFLTLRSLEARRWKG